MESVTSTIKTFLGEFIVEETKPNQVVINIGNNVRIIAYLLHPHALKPGDKVPLFTEIPYAPTQPALQ